MEGFPNDEVTLPGFFVVKYLGVQDATGLWGLKHTRRAVDDLVAAAKSGKLTSAHMPMVKLEVSEKGVSLVELGAAAGAAANGAAGGRGGRKNGAAPLSCVYPIECISYGVQDVSYSKVVAMIVVRESATSCLQEHPFRCHAFVCESKAVAKRLTLTLAAAFREFSKMVKSTRTRELYTKKFAIDLRGEEDGECVPEDSEA
uniref:Putative low density lipoprotein receptor adapter protein n=1 Tax=Amblyomma cajennense TaxID=34607 RepID=A0A023FRQ0_AMBCJ